MAESNEGTSRRELVKKAAIAGGIVWAAPVITTMNTAAFASGASPKPGGSSTTVPGEFCDRCEGDFCFGQTICSSPGEGVCGCGQLVDGDGCFCYQDDACVNRTPCPGGQSDCPTGQVCVHTCCDTDGSPVCWDPCAHVPARSAAHREGVPTGMRR